MGINKYIKFNDLNKGEELNMIKGLETEHFSIQERQSDKDLVGLKVGNNINNSIIFPKSDLIELKELIEICSKYL